MMFYFRKTPFFIQLLFKQISWRGNASGNAVYLTFDDGPVPQSTPFILDILKKHQVRASFFCLGKNVEKHPDLYQRILKEGHSVGMHGHDHLSGWSTGKKIYLENVERSAKLIQSKLFRPPFGRMTYPQYAALRKKYKIVMWSMMPGDFDRRKKKDAWSDFTLKHATPGEIITLHDNQESIKFIKPYLDPLIQELKKKKFTFDLIH